METEKIKEVKPQYDIDDEVYFMESNKIVEGTIIGYNKYFGDCSYSDSINTFIGGEPPKTNQITTYWVKHTPFFYEHQTSIIKASDMYASKKALVNEISK